MVSYAPYIKKMAPRDEAIEGFMRNLTPPCNPDAYLQVTPNHEAGFASFKRYDREEPKVDTEAWEVAEVLMRNYWIPRIVNGQPGNAAGDPGCMVHSSLPSSCELMMSFMEQSTSAGFPFSKCYRNKKACIAAESKSICRTVGDWFNGTDYAFLWTCSVKGNETRPAAKIAKNSLRTFIAPPIDLLVIMMLLCYDFNRRFYDCCHTSWSYVGGSMYNGEWDQLYKRLARFARGFELDETAYDSTVFRRLFRMIVDLRFSCMKGSQRCPKLMDLLERLYDCIVYAFIVMTTGEVFRKMIGNPSGSFNTAVDNTLSLFFLFMYAWVVLAREYDIKKVMHPFDYVEAGLYGDDNTWTVDGSVIGWFNATNVITVWKTIGVEARAAVTTTPRPLIELCFLSNNFASYKGFIVPRPSIERVFCSWLNHTQRPTWLLGTWMRSCGLRLTSLFHQELFVLIDSWCQSVFQSREQCAMLDTLAVRDNVDWRSMYLPKEALYKIYIRLESTSLNQCLSFEYSRNYCPPRWEGEWYGVYSKEPLCPILLTLLRK